MFESQQGLILSRFLVPCRGYYSSDLSLFFTFEGGVHTIEKGTQQFGVWQLRSSLTLCFLRFFATRFFDLVGARYHTSKIEFFIVLRRFCKSFEFTGLEVILLLKFEFILF